MGVHVKELAACGGGLDVLSEGVAGLEARDLAGVPQEHVTWVNVQGSGIRDEGWGFRV